MNTVASWALNSLGAFNDLICWLKGTDSCPDMRPNAKAMRNMANSDIIATAKKITRQQNCSVTSTPKGTPNNKDKLIPTYMKTIHLARCYLLAKYAHIVTERITTKEVR